MFRISLVMKRNNHDEEEEEFEREDEDDKNAWDLSAPIFEDFFIIGPNKNNKLQTLYHFPNKKTDQEYSVFLFPEGIEMEPKTYAKHRHVKLQFATENPILDNIIYYKVEGSHPTFVYATIFVANPFSYPAITKPYVLDNLIQYKTNFQNVPSYKCAFAFVTKHPFHDLFFGLLKTLLQLEYTTRNTKQNLRILNPNFIIDSHFNPFDYWPCRTYTAREDFLNSLYITNLPVFGESFGLKFNIANFKDFSWTMPEREVIEFCPAAVGFNPFMSWVQANEFVRLVESVLLGCYIIVYGDNYSEITRTVSFIPQIIAPFSWSYSVLAFVLDVEFFGSPVPYIAGTYRKYLENADRDFLPEDVIFIDVDNHTIDFPEANCKMPCHDDLIISIKPLFTVNIDFSIVQGILKLTQSRIMSTIIAPMEEALECRLDIKLPGSRFKIDQYNKHFKGDDLAFVERLEESQNFNCLTNKLCRINTHLKQGHGEDLDGLGEWAAAVWKQQNMQTINKPVSPTRMLNVFNPYS